jgi:hypothetical protein
MAGVVTEQDGFEEAVLVFAADNTGIETEMRATDFDGLVAGAAGLEQYAASVVKAVFAVIGAAMSVRSMVFFTFNVDEEGVVDPSFNLPLRYLADNAGPGPDLGAGPVRLACRGKCPVPWHSVNMWEPVNDPEEGSIAQVQKSIWRNRLGLKPSGALDRITGSDLVLTDARADHKELEARLKQTFGEEGKVNLENLIRQHSDRLSEVSDRYRTEIQDQQQGYLNQIKGCREEIRELKAALRHEQQRSRRLQELLRGEP